MPEIETLTELLSRLGGVVTSPDSLAALADQGFTLSPAIRERLAAAVPTATLSGAQRERLAASARRLGTVRFSVASSALPAFDDPLPEGEYDFAAALRLAVVDETLAALFVGFQYPREITKGVDALFTRARLELLSEDVPPSPARIGPLLLTEPLTVEAVNGSDHLLVTQLFSLEFRARGFPPHTPAEVTVSSLRGTARFGVALGAEVDGDRLRLRLADFISTPTPAERLRLTVAADSPVQPRSAKALAAFAEKIDSPLRFILSGKLSEAVETISPIIHLPVEAGGDISVHDVGVRTHRSGDGDVVVVGVRVATVALSDPGVGDPDTLGDPFTGGALNSYIRIHEGLFRKMVKQALDSGALQDAAAKEAPPEFRDDLRVDDADAEVRDNEIRIVLDIRIVDACGVVIHTIDVNARVTVTFRFTVFGGELFVTRSTDIDVSNADVAACLVTASLELVLAGAVGGLIHGLEDAFRQFKHFRQFFPDADEDEGKFEVLSAAFESPLPVPGTEVLPRAEAVQSLVGRDDLHLVESLGTVSMRRDDVNTYVYARFVRRPIDIGQPSTPLVDARVQLIDQDVPAPVRDDVVPPKPQTSTTTKDGVVTKRMSHFVAPTGNQVLATGATDNQGRVAFVLQPDQLRTTAGSVVTTVFIGDVEEPPGNQTSEEPVEERLPDVYFRVTPTDGDGPAFNTRTLDRGFVQNLRERRIGTVTAPLTFDTGKGPVATE
jgi:hypothetical protein